MSTRAVEIVADLMTRDVATLNASDQLSVADDVMTLGRVRHMPVLSEEGTLVGVISQRDLLHGSLTSLLGHGSVSRGKLLSTILVKQAMAPDPITIEPGATLAEAASVMVKKSIGCLPVVEAGRLVGILTEGDFVRLHLPEPAP